MKTQALLTAVVTMFLVSAGSAYAASVTVTGTYSLSYSSVVGNAPTITDDGNTGPDGGTLSSPFTENLNLNTPTTNTNFFTATPARTSGCSWPCTGNTASEDIKVTFGFTAPSGITNTVSATGVYTADYNNDTDSINWTSGTSGSPLVVDFSDGAVLDITLVDASDWSITPDISFDLKDDPSATPLPPALSLFGGGLGMLGMLGWRRKRKAAAIAA
jgi:hypothetical protein